MTAFFQSMAGTSFPVSRIRSISGREEKPVEGSFGCSYYSVQIDGGDAVKISKYELDRLNNAPCHLIPALPGTYLLGNVVAEDATVADVWQKPVIAWAVGSDGEVIPYTPNGADDGISRPSPILMPNGLVVEAGSQSWRSLDDWFVEAHEKAVNDASAKSEAVAPSQ